MHVTAYSPMGHGKSYWNDSIASIREKEIIDIAAKHGVTPGQVKFILHSVKKIVPCDILCAPIPIVAAFIFNNRLC